MSETNKQPETVERSGQAPFAGLIGLANFDGETVEAALKRDMRKAQERMELAAEILRITGRKSAAEEARESVTHIKEALDWVRPRSNDPSSATGTRDVGQTKDL